jgi:hypothetical protein
MRTTWTAANTLAKKEMIARTMEIFVSSLSPYCGLPIIVGQTFDNYLLTARRQASYECGTIASITAFCEIH